MKRMAVAVVWLLALLAWAAVPPVVELYDRVVPKVIEAKRVLEKDPAQALLYVEEAEKAFAEGKDVLPPVIAAGIELALEEARISVTRRSKADLEGRLWVLRGAFAKALYDAFFEAVAAGDLEAARAILDKLIEASARPETLKEEAWRLVEAGDIEGLRRLFEKAYIEAILKSLELAGDGERKMHAFALVSKAYGLFIIIQDSPRVREVTPQDFVDALAALASGDLETYRAKVEEIKAKLEAALEALESEPEIVPESPAPDAQGPGAGRPLVNPDFTKVVFKESFVPAAAPAAAFKNPDDTFLTLVEDLAFLLEDRALAERVAQELASAGVLSLEEWKNQLYIAEGYVATAQAYLSTGDFARARTYLGFARGRFRFSLYPLVAAVDPELARDTEELFNKLTEGLGLRSSDVAVLAVALERARAVVFDEKVNPWFNVQIAVEKATFGLFRAILFLVAGALSLFPIYLLRITFGGGNVYWRLLGYAFFLLFLPAIFEGLAYLGEILAYYGGLPQLAVLSNLSVFQNIVVQLFFGLLIFLVVLLSGWGLRGIARQFGLISERGKPAAPITEESEVEWDEEF